ncbi:MAG: hypothetical protein KDJ35_07680 [Alphaproteobacteria bacterium]|nr:hypothetical protein [Alphaproteobacteria bacterium]
MYMISDDENYKYDVYIYHHPANTNEKLQDWERKSTTQNLHRALMKAKKLYKSRKYHKVEVTKCKLDSEENCVRSSIFRVYEPGSVLKKALWGLGGAAILLGAALFIALVYVL